MTGDCHVRFRESGGLECPPPLDHKAKKHKKAHKRHAKVNRGGVK
jgi:hypothetical protein